MKIIEDDLTGQAIANLLRQHLEHMTTLAPPESTHALGIEQLRDPDVTFWSAWQGDELMGCGALKELTSQHGEIKSMRTATDYLGKGVAAHLLQHIIDQALQRGYDRLSLETGSMEAFQPAHKLYSKFGFVECPPFADYVLDPNSIFMTLELSPR